MSSNGITRQKKRQRQRLFDLLLSQNDIVKIHRHDIGKGVLMSAQTLIVFDIFKLQKHTKTLKYASK